MLNKLLVTAALMAVVLGGIVTTAPSLAQDDDMIVEISTPQGSVPTMIYASPENPDKAVVVVLPMDEPFQGIENWDVLQNVLPYGSVLFPDFDPGPSGWNAASFQEWEEQLSVYLDMLAADYGYTTIIAAGESISATAAIQGCAASTACNGVVSLSAGEWIDIVLADAFEKLAEDNKPVALFSGSDADPEALIETYGTLSNVTSTVDPDTIAHGSALLTESEEVVAELLRFVEEALGDQDCITDAPPAEAHRMEGSKNSTLILYRDLRLRIVFDDCTEVNLDQWVNDLPDSPFGTPGPMSWDLSKATTLPPNVTELTVYFDTYQRADEDNNRYYFMVVVTYSDDTIEKYRFDVVAPTDAQVEAGALDEIRWIAPENEENEK